MTAFKPMLAFKDNPDLSMLRYPLLVSPKLDGVRALVMDGVVRSRSLKVIPNPTVQQLFGTPEFEGFDGELIVGSPTNPLVFSETTSGVMSKSGKPDVHLFSFDLWNETKPFAERFSDLSKRIENSTLPRIAIVPHKLVQSVEELDAFEAEMVDLGYEGIMIRDPGGAYKCGRTTLKEHLLYKLKRFETGEAVIVGFEEELKNTNEAKRNEVGALERSTAKAGKVGKGTLGKFICRDLVTGIEFRCGSGLTAAQRAAFWPIRESFLGKILSYKYFPHGSQGAPRYPIFRWFRDPIDMGEPA